MSELLKVKEKWRNEVLKSVFFESVHGISTVYGRRIREMGPQQENRKKCLIVLDKHLLKLLNFSCIIKKRTHLFLTWDLDKEGTPCLFSAKDILCLVWMQLKLL